MKSLKEFEGMKKMNHGIHRLHGKKILTLGPAMVNSGRLVATLQEYGKL